MAHLLSLERINYYIQWKITCQDLFSFFRFPVNRIIRVHFLHNFSDDVIIGNPVGRIKLSQLLNCFTLYFFAVTILNRTLS